MISSSATDYHDNNNSHGSGTNPAGDQQIESETTGPNQGSLLIDATCVPADIRYPTDLSLLNEARELTETLIDAMHSHLRESFGSKPRTHRKQARKQFLAVAKKKRPRINMIRKAIKQQLGHLKRNLASIDALTACGASLLVAGRYAYRKLLVALRWSVNRTFFTTLKSEVSLIVSSASAKPTSGRLFAVRRGATLSLAPRSRSPSLEKDSPSSIDLVLIHTMKEKT
jgi:hypothetical protein